MLHCTNIFGIELVQISGLFCVFNPTIIGDEKGSNCVRHYTRKSTMYLFSSFPLIRCFCHDTKEMPARKRARARVCVHVYGSLGFFSAVFIAFGESSIRHISLMGYVGIFIVCYFIPAAATKGVWCGQYRFQCRKRFKAVPETPAASPTTNSHIDNHFSLLLAKLNEMGMTHKYTYYRRHSLWYRTSAEIPIRSRATSLLHYTYRVKFTLNAIGYYFSFWKDIFLVGHFFFVGVEGLLFIQSRLHMLFR